MNKVTIEGVQPIVEVNPPKLGRPCAYPFDKLLEVGQSFFVRGSISSFLAVSTATKRAEKRMGGVGFNAFKAERNDVEGTRVQRIK